MNKTYVNPEVEILEFVATECIYPPTNPPTNPPKEILSSTDTEEENPTTSCHKYTFTPKKKLIYVWPFGWISCPW